MFGHVEERKVRLEDQIMELEANICSQPVFEQEKELKEKITELDKYILQEVVLLKQKFWDKWLKEGEANMIFFHPTVQQRMKKATISKMILEDGTALNSALQIHDATISQFQDLLTSSSSGQETNLENVISLVVTEEENANLIRETNADEVMEALKEILTNSSSGPSGFWIWILSILLIKEDMVEATNEFSGVFLSLGFSQLYCVSYRRKTALETS